MKLTTGTAQNRHTSHTRPRQARIHSPVGDEPDDTPPCGDLCCFANGEGRKVVECDTIDSFCAFRVFSV